MKVRCLEYSWISSRKYGRSIIPLELNHILGYGGSIGVGNIVPSS